MSGSEKSEQPGAEANRSSHHVLPEPDDCPAHEEDIVSRQVAGETIIVPIKATPGELADIFTLNEIAAKVWELIDGDRTVAAISEKIALEYDVSEEQSLIDTLELISMFHEAKLVNISDAV